MKKSLYILALLAGTAPAFPALAQTNAAPFTTGYRYDAERRPTGTISPDPDGGGPLRHAAVRNSYDPAGRLTRIEKGELAQWQSEAVAPANWTGFTVLQTVDMAYDALDRKVREAVSGVASTGGAATVQTVTEYSWDLDGRPLCTAVRMNPAHWSTPLANKCVGGPVHATWGPDRIAKSVHDAAGQLVQSWEGVGTGNAADLAAEATRSYDGNGKLRFLIDAKGNRSEMRYDGLGRLECWILPSANGPAPGTYDPTDQTSALQTAGAVNGNCNPQAPSGDFEYYGHDANGNRTNLRNRAGETLSYNYDALDRMTSKNRPGSEPDVAYTYDNRGLQLSASFPSAGESVESGWDGFGRIVSSTTIRGGFAVAYGYQYDSDGNRNSIAHPDGPAFAYDRDGLGRVSAIRHGGSTPIAIAYDPMGRRKSLARGDGSIASYDYDGASRLTRLFDNLPGAGDRTVTLAYNPASQIASRAVDNNLYAWTGHGSGSSSTPADGLNRTTAVDGVALGYDAKGNLIFDGARSFVYDSENRLSNPAAPFHYDPLGRMAGVSASPGAPLALAYDQSEGEGLIAERVPGSLAPIKRHVFGPGADEPLIWYEGSATAAPRYLHADERGSIVAVTDSSGAVQNYMRYDEYGRTESSNPYWQARFGYTGQRYFGGTGLYYYKARFYHPKLGRFMQVDPIGYDDQINLYAYVGNDPVNRIDPNGMCCRESTDPDKDPVSQMGRSVMEDPQGSAERAATFIEHVSLAVDVLNSVVSPGPEASVVGKAMGAGIREAAESRAKSMAKGVPDTRIGGSGKPKQHTVMHSTRKAAREAAERDAPRGGKVRHDSHPTNPKQGPHFQAEGPNKAKVHPTVHHEHPKRR